MSYIMNIFRNPCLNNLNILGIPVAFILAQVEKAWHSPLAILSSLATSWAYATFLAIGLLVALALAILAYHYLIPRLGLPVTTLKTFHKMSTVPLLIKKPLISAVNTYR